MKYADPVIYELDGSIHFGVCLSITTIEDQFGSRKFVCIRRQHVPPGEDREITIEEKHAVRYIGSESIGYLVAEYDLATWALETGEEMRNKKADPSEPTEAEPAEDGTPMDELKPCPPFPGFEQAITELIDQTKIEVAPPEPDGIGLAPDVQTKLKAELDEDIPF